MNNKQLAVLIESIKTSIENEIEHLKDELSGSSYAPMETQSNIFQKERTVETFPILTGLCNIVANLDTQVDILAKLDYKVDIENLTDNK